MTDKTLFETPFVSLIDREGYVFVHESRSDGKIISLLPFRRTRGRREYLARVEICPAHTVELTPERYSITGGVEKGHTPAQTAVIEALEEAGYSISESELIDLGMVRPTKSADTTAYLFAVDVTGKSAVKAMGDGSKWEQDATTEWLRLGDAVQVQDPLFVTAIARLTAHVTTSEAG
jgi:8-oxo-dGTP pyrophosphatase MutT (NUDIX family)